MSGRSRAAQRTQLATVLLVGEGHAEVALLHHLKTLYAPRGCGLAVTIKNAHGKGASHVVDYAIRQARNAAFDHKLALLDADTDWSAKVQTQASQGGIHVVACEPCLEALLLSVHGALRAGRSPAQLKRDFLARFGVQAHERDLYAAQFPRERLELARHTVGGLDQLLKAFSTPMR
ncbi:MAG: hypothetical protein Q4G71_08065 [Pseudomonadota bacterium]|nr:hypothetical protein [Pseudomonadota bacterium]